MLFCYLLSRITISRCETVYEVWREKILPWWCLSTCWFKRRRRRGFVLAFMNRLSFVMRTWRCRNIFQGHEIFREERTSFECPSVRRTTTPREILAIWWFCEISITTIARLIFGGHDAIKSWQKISFDWGFVRNFIMWATLLNLFFRSLPWMTFQNKTKPIQLLLSDKKYTLEGSRQNVHFHSFWMANLLNWF